MRKLIKVEPPEILKRLGPEWLRDFLQQPANQTRRFRYRHEDIKTRLKEETSGKCVYCESKIGHNTPGDVEHILPVSRCNKKLFVWENLTIACTECNRRKGAYYDPNCSFMDPYLDDVEERILHYGPIVSWRTGDVRAEVTVKRLELNSATRIELITRKIERIDEVKHLMERIVTVAEPTLKKLLRLQLDEWASRAGEFSAMVRAVRKTNF